MNDFLMKQSGFYEADDFYVFVSDTKRDVVLCQYEINDADVYVGDDYVKIAGEANREVLLPLKAKFIVNDKTSASFEVEDDIEITLTWD